MGCDDANWIHLAIDTTDWRIFMTTTTTTTMMMMMMIDEFLVFITRSFWSKPTSTAQGRHRFR
jgi:hypothetical protein